MQVLQPQELEVQVWQPQDQEVQVWQGGLLVLGQQQQWN